jgi:hypothetical protein
MSYDRVKERNAILTNEMTFLKKRPKIQKQSFEKNEGAIRVQQLNHHLVLADQFEHGFSLLYHQSHF